MKEKYKNIRRRFSEDFKRSIVSDIDHGRLRVADVVKDYEVCRQAVYKWLHKYSVHYKRKTHVVIQMDSESTQKQELLKRIAELEQALGQKQLKLDYLEKLIEISERELNIDIKKKGEHPHWNGSDNTRKNTPGQ